MLDLIKTMPRNVYRAATTALPPFAESRRTVGVLVEEWASSTPRNIAVIDSNESIDWAEFNARANALAHKLVGLGIRQGDTVALSMQNRVDFVVSVIAIAKIGASVALMNTAQTGEVLKGSFGVVEPTALIIGEEQRSTITRIRKALTAAGVQNILWVSDPEAPEAKCPSWAIDLHREVAQMPRHNLPMTKQLVKSLPLYKVFTSGTTGLPKAAIMSHKRWMLAAAGFGPIGARFDHNDRMYITLPLYHNNAASIGFGAVVASGGSMVLRRKFSASKFWSDVRDYNCTAFVYIGELCRYLLMQPPSDIDATHKVRKIIGNGLRPDLWMEFKQRFGIERVCEFYAASESNTAFINFFNLDQTVGCSPADFELVAYDVDEDDIRRDAQGRAIKVQPGEPGLLVTLISDRFPLDGYTDEGATRKKVLRDLFKSGDTYFNTGDLMRQVEVPVWIRFRHLQFVDRVGDTFRWKGENVSTTEVEAVLTKVNGVQESTVYGVQVPHRDGRAGMAAIVVDSLDILETLGAKVAATLPPYAVPQFVRILTEIETTGTFKHRKGDLKKVGFNRDETDDAIYWLQGGAYVPLDADDYAAIQAGQAKI